MHTGSSDDDEDPRQKQNLGTHTLLLIILHVRR